jgi:hypothetical protein
MMEKRVIVSLLAISAALFVAALGMAAFARPYANDLIWIAGRSSTGLAVSAAALFIAAKMAAARRVG